MIKQTISTPCIFMVILFILAYIIASELLEDRLANLNIPKDDNQYHSTIDNHPD